MKLFQGCAGQARISRLLFNALSKDQGESENTLYNLKSPYKVMALKAETLNNAKLSKFETLELPLPAKADDYIAEWYGTPWSKLDKSRLKPISANRVRYIHSADVSFEKTLNILSEAGCEYRSLQQDIFDYQHWRNKRLNPAMATASRGYAAARLSRDRIDIYSALQPKMHELELALKNNDIETLRSALEECDYFERTDRFFAYGLGLFATEGIFKFAKAMWKKEDCGDYATKVLDLVPDYYKQKSLDKILASYQ